MNVPLDDYLLLLSRFITGTLSAIEFEQTFLTCFKADETLWEEEVFNVLDKLFSDVDEFVAEPHLRLENSLDEHQLLEAAQEAYQKLLRVKNRTMTVAI